LVEQINDYRQKLSENQKSLKQKAQTEQQIPALKQTVEELRIEKQVTKAALFNQKKKKKGKQNKKKKTL
jgi:hypothetical protein